MVSSPPQKSVSEIQSLVTAALEQRILGRRDHLALSTAMLSDPALTVGDRQHINQVFDGLRNGRVRLVN